MHALTEQPLQGRVRLLHFQAGRARFAVAGLYRNPSLALHLRGQLGEAHAVTRCDPNPLTGNLLLGLRPAARLDLLIAAIEQLIESAPPPPAAVPRPAAAKPARPAVKTGAKRSPKAPAAAPLEGSARASTPRWHAAPAEAVASDLGVAPERGLSSAEAGARLARFGPNLLGEQQRRSPFAMFVQQFQSLPVGLLGVSAAVALATGGALDAGVIVAVTLINAAIGFTTERQAERIIGSLADTGPRTARVLRDGEARELPAQDLVPGDLLLLTPGSYVPADLRLIESRRLTLDESALTGESMPVEKDAQRPVAADAPLGDRGNMAHMGTTVTGGSGSGIAVFTGQQTEIGRIQSLIGHAEAPDTPMQRQLDRLGTQLALISGAICVGVFAIGLARGFSLLTMLKASISLAVAAVPEGLPTVATTTLALGIARMRKHQVAVRHLDAVESLGAVQSFCLDKTGTLTRNRMSLVAVHCGLEQITLDEGALYCGGVRVELTGRDALRQLFEVVVLCNESEIDESGTPQSGSPTEIALLTGAAAAGIDPRRLRSELPRESVQYRSEGRPYMKSVHRLADGSALVAVKGSPAAVLALCDQIRHNDTVQALDESIREMLIAENDAMAGDALRVLAVAYAEVPAGEHTGGRRLTWLGLTGMADPLRPGVEKFIRELQGAGVNTVMITGDQSATAYAIGRQLRLAGDGELNIIDSTALEKLDPELLAGLVKNVHVFSRVSPANKLQIVQALQRSGHVVAMTGDGINDGPALKAADIGVAMGGSGTDVARAVADVVIEDDNLGTMVDAIRQGRTIYGNIRKSVHFLLATNLSEIEVMLAGIAFGTGAPLSPMQLLWINLISDIFPGLALSLEPPEADVLARPPRDPNEPIVRRQDLARVGIESTLLSLGALASYLYAVRRYGVGPRAGTHAFTTLALAQLLHAYAARSDRHTIFERGALPPNPYLTAAIGGSIALQFGAMLVPGLRGLLGVVPVSLVDTLVICGSAAAPLLLNETIKGARRMR